MEKDYKEVLEISMFSGGEPMKVIDMSTKASAAAYLGHPPEQTHNKTELESLHRAIRFTKMFRQAEADEIAKQEELIERPLPNINPLALKR